MRSITIEIRCDRIMRNMSNLRKVGWDELAPEVGYCQSNKKTEIAVMC